LHQFNAKRRRKVVAAAETAEWLSSLAWPGNVRELENAVERAVTLNVGGRLMPEDFIQFALAPMANSAGSSEVLASPAAAPARDAWQCKLPSTLEEVEREHILATLRFTRGNKLRAAELLGIGRYSLYRKAKRLNINLDDLSSPAGENQKSSGSRA